MRLLHQIYFNPLPPDGGRRLDGSRFNSSRVISIHSLRTEGDDSIFVLDDLPAVISIHSLRTEGDYGDFELYIPADISIHSLRTEGDFVLTVELI